MHGKAWNNAALAFWAAACSLTAQSAVPIRAWQLHTLDVPYVKSALRLAQNYDVNTVVFSHEMIGYASQLFDGGDRGRQLTELAAAAHSAKLNVWIWVREFEGVPDRFLSGGKLEIDRPGFWDWLGARYERIFDAYPGFDGIVLTFEESPYRVMDEAKVQSSLPMTERFAKVINVIDEVCRRNQKALIVRSFLYEPEQMQWFQEGYAKTNPHFMIQTKCEPHDWDPFYPDDPMIGAFPKRQQIIEFDGSSEYTGKNRIPYTQPEYFERRWRYDLSQPGVVGYNIRVDHGGYDALHTPNEINIYAMYRFTQDSRVTSADVWREWTEMHYGSAAARELEQALQPTFDIVNQAFFALKFWMTNHSRLPDFSYANEHLHLRTLAKWYPGEAQYKATEERLLNPDPELLEQILAEKDAAIAEAHGALQHLEAARPNLTPAQYEDLYWRLSLEERTAIIWRLHAEAFFGYKVLAAGHRVPGLASRVQRALDALRKEAAISQADPRIGANPPASEGEIRQFVNDLDTRLAQLEPGER